MRSEQGLAIGGVRQVAGVDRGDNFSDAALATTILGRLPHHPTTINIKGESYRLHTKRKASLLGAPAREEEGKATTG